MNYRFYPCEFCCNTYIITASDGSAAVIDPGYEGTEGYNAAIALGSKLKYILLTHRHSDHLLATAPLAAATGAKIAIGRLDAEGLLSPSASLFYEVSSWRFASQTTVNADILLDDGDKITFCDVTLTVMNTPGHTVGGVCYVCGDVIFSGDTLFKDSMGRVDFPTGDVVSMAKTLCKLADLEGDYTVCSGHGDITTLQNEREHNMYIRMAKNGTLYG